MRPGEARPQMEESEYVRSLPDWARRFLRNSAAAAQAPAVPGAPNGLAAIPELENTVQWTAPNYRPPETPTSFREKRRTEQPRQSGEVRISEAEIQRTADRVYEIIEDRIRRERRRLGL